MMTICDREHDKFPNNIIDGFNFKNDDDGDLANITDYLSPRYTHSKNGIIEVAPKANLALIK